MTKWTFPALIKFTCDDLKLPDHYLTFFVPGALRAYAASIESKKYYCVTVTRPHRPRTTGPNSQNHRLNGFISQFCDSTGNDFEDIKLYLKRRAMRRGLPAKINEKNEIVYSKVDGEPIPISEKDMNTEQCGWVISEIEQLAAEYGVILQEE